MLSLFFLPFLLLGCCSVIVPTLDRCPFKNSFSKCHHISTCASNKLQQPTVLVVVCRRFVSSSPSEWSSSVSGTEVRASELTLPEFVLITLSQLPALSMLLKGSTATPPGHVSPFGIAPGKWMQVGGCRASRPSSAEATPQRIQLERETYETGTKEKYFMNGEPS